MTRFQQALLAHVAFVAAVSAASAQPGATLSLGPLFQDHADVTGRLVTYGADVAPLSSATPSR